MQDKYDQWEAESPHSPNHHHHPQLGEFFEKIKGEISLTQGRYEALHKADLENIGSQKSIPKENSNSNSNSNHIPGHLP